MQECGNVARFRGKTQIFIENRGDGAGRLDNDVRNLPRELFSHDVILYSFERIPGLSTVILSASDIGF